MRGKVWELLFSFHCARITPAHAGKSSLPAVADGVCRDHPRTCGEKAQEMGKSLQLQGSPPHMRGKVSSGMLVRDFARITPAHAGKSSGCSVAADQCRDHPRTCGEKCGGPQLRPPRAGSPPHMRGKEGGLFFSLAVIRITPAHAGKRD